MKSILTIITLFLLFVAQPLIGQSLTWHEGIVQTNINVRGNAVAVGQISINVPQAGKVVVRFDGNCISTPGDRIVLAASNTADWGVNDGNLGVEAVDGDLNRNSFSHTRVYPVTAGNHTFYAVAENYVETAGTGVASIYGSLTVEYFPSTSAVIVEHQGIVQTNINVEGSPVAVGQININAPSAGKVMVRFDGNCISSAGDRIILAASNTANWSPNDGNVGVEALDGDLNRSPFSHTRVYDVNAGNHSFYAIAQNYVETDGNGIASIYGSLTVEFVPNSASEIIASQGISQTSVNVRGSAVTVGQVTINAPVAGTVVVNFDGSCIATPGDRIVLGASNTPDWGVNDGNVGVEAINSDLNAKCFSHTRSYDVPAGNHTFYAVAENYVETDGTGVASIYANVTAQFSPNTITATKDQERLAAQVSIYPNPTRGHVHLSMSQLEANQAVRLQVIDASGRVLQTTAEVSQQGVNTDLSSYPDGLYFFELTDENTRAKATKRVMKGQ